MISFKYFIITIAAIFISIGMGILIGLNLNGPDLYLKQQQLLLDGIEKKFNEMEDERKNFTSQIEGLIIENTKKQQFMEKLGNQLIQGKLENYNIAIIRTSDKNDHKPLKDFLEMAGANIPLEVIYTTRIHNLNTSHLNSLSKYNNNQMPDIKELIKLINHDVMDLVSIGRKSPLLEKLRVMGIIEYALNEDILVEGPIHYVILFGGQTETYYETVQQIDTDIIKRCKRYVIPIVAVEMRDTPYSLIQYYQEEEIPIIENIDHVMGKIALVFLIAADDGLMEMEIYN